jgi:hypothetical protein
LVACLFDADHARVRPVRDRANLDTDRHTYELTDPNGKPNRRAERNTFG